MIGARRSCSRCVTSVALVSILAGGLAAVSPAGAAGIEDLERVVEAACQCAAGYPTGMDAALGCPDGPREFGRLKVARQDALDGAAQARAAELERIIEACITNAEDLAGARARLGLSPLHDEPAAQVTWRRVPPGELASYPSALVRIDVGAGAPLKGLVESLDGITLSLRLARSDGGGREDIPVEAIRGAWVLVLPQP